MNTNQIISRVNLIKVNSNGTKSTVGDWITTNHNGWYQLSGYGFTSLTMEGLSSMVGKKLGRIMMITATM